MIAKAIKGRGFRGALEYDLSKDGCALLATNMDGQSPREFAREFGEIRKLRPTLGKAVLHVSLSAAPGENLTDAQWIDIGQHYLNGMGLCENQYIITRHADTEHEHIHMLVNRIRFDGQVVSDSHDYRRQETLMREIEHHYSLQQVPASKDALRRAPTKGEIEEGLRTGVASTRQLLQQLCDSAVNASSSYSEYAAALEAAEIELMPVTQLGGTRLTGLTYRLDGVTMKGSDLGKGYSPNGLAKRGISYEKDRDFKTVVRQREQGQALRPGGADWGSASSEDHKRRGAGNAAGTDRSSDGSADGRDATKHERDRGKGRRARRTHTAANHDGSTGMRGCDETRGGRSEADRGGLPFGGGSQLLPSHSDRLYNGGARERILALACTADRLKLPRPESGSGHAAPRDRTLEAVKRQMTSMGAERYEIVLADPKRWRKEKRQWRPDELLRSVAWLKRMNAFGYEIFIAPVEKKGLVLVDGLRNQTIAKLADHGLMPAVIIKIGRGTYQVWANQFSVTASTPFDARGTDERSVLGRIANDCATTSYGRLAGFAFEAINSGEGKRRRFAVVYDAPSALTTRSSFTVTDGGEKDAAGKKSRLKYK